MQRSGLPRPVLAISASLIGALAMVVSQQAAQLWSGLNPLSRLRTNFWHDQLGYLAIAADARVGDIGSSEPVTMTGVSHYPRLYYTSVGLLARSLGLETVTAWNLAALVLQFAAALAIGLTLAALTRRWWTGLLAPIPFLTGTFAYLLTPGSWYTRLDAHAVLWGPYGVLFSHNGETAGLCVGIVAVCALVWAWCLVTHRAARIALTVIAAAAVGVLSSFQTYSFLTMAYALSFGAAAAGLTLARRRAPSLAMTGILLVVVLIAGPIIAGRFGQLPTLVFGVLPALPGLVVAARRSRGLVAVAVLAAAGAAMPQVLFTVGGMASGDPFLTYRVASNSNLGVTDWAALVSAAAVLVPLIALSAIAVRVRDTAAIALTLGPLVSFVLLALNDVWGANAEPYRFWIDGLLIGGVVALLAIGRLWGLLRPRRPRSGESRGGRDHSRRSAPGSRTLVAVVVVSALIWGASLPDWVTALRDDEMQATWDPRTERERAIAELAQQAARMKPRSLLTTELCIDNRTTKVTSGAPVANYHLGMAWPAHRDEVDSIIAARDDGALDFDAMAASGTRWMLTDSNCFSRWHRMDDDRLERIAELRYDLAAGERIAAGDQGPGTITLWRVR